MAQATTIWRHSVVLPERTGSESIRWTVATASGGALASAAGNFRPSCASNGPSSSVEPGRTKVSPVASSLCRSVASVLCSVFWAGHWRTGVAPLLALASALALPFAVALGYSVTVAFFGLALLLTGVATVRKLC